MGRKADDERIHVKFFVFTCGRDCHRIAYENWSRTPKVLALRTIYPDEENQPEELERRSLPDIDRRKALRPDTAGRRPGGGGSRGRRGGEGKSRDHRPGTQQKW